MFRDTVVFSDNRNGNWDIYSYDLKTGVEKRLSSDPATQTSPAVCGPTVVWEDWRNGNPDIYSYDLATGVEKRLTTDAGNETRPAVSDGRVVYCYQDKQLRLLDLLAGTTMTLTSPGMEMDYGHGFSISGDLVGWVVYQPGLNPPPILWRPYVHDLSTGVGRFVGGIDAYGADLSLNRLATWTQSSAVAYDVQTGDTLAAPWPDPIWTWKPRAAVASGRTMVARWDQVGGSYSHNLWAWDFGLGRTSLITSATTALDHPAVSGRNVVWADKRNGTWDIYAYDLGIAVPRIDVTPGSASFGDVMLGASSAKTVTIKNSGDATLVVRSVALETPVSGVSLGSVLPSTTVAPGASLQVKLTFAPTVAGPVSTVLKVVSDDADLPVVRIPVTGAGVNRRLTLDALDQTLPELFRDTVVFSDNRNGNWDIYSYDLKTGAEKRLTSDPTTQTSPAVCGPTVVWEDWRNGNPDIYSYDLATGVEKRLTTDAGQHKTPDISDGRVVYCYYGGSQSSSWSGIWDIRLIDLLSAARPRSPGQTPGWTTGMASRSQATAWRGWSTTTPRARHGRPTSGT